MAKAGASATAADDLMEAAQAVTRAMGRPESGSQMLPMLQKIQTVLVGMAKGPGPAQGPGGGAAPGAGAPGAPGGAGMGPPGGGAANPAMPSLTGGSPQGGSAPPGAGATNAIPQVPPDELRRMLAQQTG